MVLKENSAGFVPFVDTLTAGEAGVIRLMLKKNGNYLSSGLLKDTRSGNWQIKAAIARGSFIV